MNAEPIGTEHRPAPDAEPEALDVAAEMAAIFGPATREPGADLPRSRAVVPVLAPRRDRWRVAIASGLAALLVAVCFVLAWSGRPTAERLPVRSTISVLPAARIVPSGPPRFVVVAPQSSPAPVSSRSRPDAVREAPPRPAPARRTAKHPASTVARPTRSDRIKDHPTRRAERDAVRCDARDADARAWCMQPAILAADRDLRAAYNRAVARGVDRDTLLDYRRDWTRR